MSAPCPSAARPIRPVVFARRVTLLRRGAPWYHRFMRFSFLIRSAALVLCCLACGFALAQNEPALAIRFPAGRSSTTVEGAVIRGERDIYSLRARAGQTMSVSVTAVERNAVFNVYAPRARIVRDKNHILDVRGTELTPSNADVPFVERSIAGRWIIPHCNSGEPGVGDVGSDVL